MTEQNQSTDSKNQIGYAVVGLGYISQIAVLPAFKNAEENSKLIALVSDDPVKLKKLGKKYNVPYTYSYEQYDECLRNPEVDAVYIALPNNMHAEYTIRSAQAKKHVLCEKPLAVTVEECEEMIDVCKENGVLLMTAYRLHFEKANLEAVEIVKSKQLGDVRIFNSVFTMQVEEGNTRLQKDLGGGTLYDIGIYCINAARNLFRQEPEVVFAWTSTNGEKRFEDVEEMASVIMRFPKGKLASFVCSFGATDISAYEVVGTKGTLKVDPAYEHAASLKHHLTIDGKTKKQIFPKRDQFGPQLIYFSRCIHDGTVPEPSGIEGLADVRIIRALYDSAESSKPIELGEFTKRVRPDGDQEIQQPPVEKPELIHAEPPSGK